MRTPFLNILGGFHWILLLCPLLAFAQDAQVCTSPPMGWNSFNSFGATVTEREVRDNADMMRTQLKSAGWQYVVVDYQWYYPYPGWMQNCPQTEDFTPSLAMDEFGRLLPTPDRFPSAVGGKGFAPLAAYIHGLGLKFGMHVMRGIPREAVARKMPVMGTAYTADQIADTGSTCPWLDNMYGLNMSKPGAQEYLNSILDLYASWGVDYVKIDDMQHTDNKTYHAEEVAGYRRAIDHCRRPMVYSISPHIGYEQAHGHVENHANLWRVSHDFWDSWPALEKQFSLLHQWQGSIAPGRFPDADMLIFGVLNQRGPLDGMPRESHFTEDEKVTVMSLWCMARSPLMYGGDLTKIRRSELKLLTNSEVLAVNQQSANNRQLFRRRGQVAWVAEVPNSRDVYVGVFNLGDRPSTVTVRFDELGFSGPATVRDLWKRSDLGSFKHEFARQLPPHGSGLFRIGAAAISPGHH